MNTEALALELRNEMYSFLTELIDEFSTSETISHDTFNKAINIRSNIIADDDLWDGQPVADTEANDNKHAVMQRSELLLAFVEWYNEQKDSKYIPNSAIGKFNLASNSA